MMFAVRSDYLFLISIVYGLAACNSAGGEPTGAAPAANGGAGVAASMSGMSASAGSGSATDAVVMSGSAAKPGASAAPSTTTGSAANAAAGVGATGATGAAGATSTAGAAAMTGAPAASASAGTMASSAGASAGAAATGGAGGATFTEVFNLLAGGCASGGYCHAAGGGLSKLELVDQTKAYTALVGTTAMGMTMPGSMTMGCSASMIVRVKAFDPDNSLLMQKLNGKQTCGAAMPPNGMLKAEELKLVHDWIAAGAKND